MMFLNHYITKVLFAIFSNINILPKLSILNNLYVVSKSLYHKSFILLVIVNEKMNIFSSAAIMVYLDINHPSVNLIVLMTSLVV